MTLTPSALTTTEALTAPATWKITITAMASLADVSGLKSCRLGCPLNLLLLVVVVMKMIMMMIMIMIMMMVMMMVNDEEVENHHSFG